MNLDEYSSLDGVALGELIANKEILPTEVAQLAKKTVLKLEQLTIMGQSVQHQIKSA